MSHTNSIGHVSLSNATVWRYIQPHVRQNCRNLWSAHLRSGRRLALLPRARSHFFRLSLWLALPLAVLTSNGWLGLAIHWLALFGAASLLEHSTPNNDGRPAEPEMLEGVASCAAVKQEAS